MSTFQGYKESSSVVLSAPQAKLSVSKAAASAVIMLETHWRTYKASAGFVLVGPQSRMNIPKISAAAVVRFEAAAPPRRIVNAEVFA